MKGLHLLFIALLLGILAGCLLPPSPPSPPSPPPVVDTTPDTESENLIGINISQSYFDWCEDRMFADVMKTARTWYKAGYWNVAGKDATLDANLWPTEDAALCVFDNSVKNMNGTYKVSFNGQVTSIDSGYGGTIVSNMVYTASTNTTTCDMIVGTNPGAFVMQFNGTGGVGIKNLKIMRPLTPGSTVSYPDNTLFTNEIKNLVSKFRVLRFMEFFSTNDSELSNWGQRSLPTDASQQMRMLSSVNGQVYVGGCYEYAVQLCNETGKDMWLNIPLKADTNYVTQLANLVKTNLNSNLKVYVEYSNEVWNTAPGFQQGPDNNALATSDSADSNSPLRFDGNTGTSIVAARRVGQKTVEISGIFRSVFGDGAMMSRVRPVLMGWSIVGGPTEAVTYIDRVYGSSPNQWCAQPHPVNYYVYGYGGSGYYNPDNSSDSLTIDSIWTSQTMNVSAWLPECQKQSATAHAFGLKRICYEGGPFLETGHSDTVKNAAFLDPRMKTSMLDHFNNAWSATDSGLFMYYSTTAGYTYGMTDDIFNFNTPKIQAVDQLVSQSKAAASVGPVPPVTLPGISFETSLYTTASSWTDGTKYHVGANHYVIYLFRTTTTGNFSVHVNLNPVSALAAGPVVVTVDGTQVGTGNSYRLLSAFSVSSLRPGLHAVAVKTTTGQAEILSVSISPQ